MYKEMSRLSKSEQSGDRRICNMLQDTLRRVAGFRSLQRDRRCGAILVPQAGWQNCGTVEPQCVFQSVMLRKPLNKGSPTCFPHGLRAQACACARTSSRKQLLHYCSMYYNSAHPNGLIPQCGMRFITQNS